MKKGLAFLVFFLLAAQMTAQDTILLNRIKAANGKIQSFEADVANTMVKPKKTLSQEGKLYFSKPNDFAALFTTGKHIIANEKKIKMDIGMFRGTFKLKDGGMMQSLANIFLYGFQGRIQELMGNDYSISTETENNLYVVTGITKKKKILGLGYKQLVFKYFTDSLMLKEIVLYDYNSNKDTYSFSNVKYDVPVDPTTFQF